MNIEKLNHTYKICIDYNVACSIAVLCDNHIDFQQCDILTSVDSEEPVQPPFKLRNSK